MDCYLCEENLRQASGDLVGAVAELETGWLRLHSRQRFRGAAFFAAKACVREFYELDEPTRIRHFEELSKVCRAIDSIFEPLKMNVESLGNGVPHLHWWITPRYVTDARPMAPIWEDLDFLREMWTGTGHAEDQELEASATLLRAALKL